MNLHKLRKLLLRGYRKPVGCIWSSNVFHRSHCQVLYGGRAEGDWSPGQPRSICAEAAGVGTIGLDSSYSPLLPTLVYLCRRH